MGGQGRVVGALPIPAVWRERRLLRPGFHVRGSTHGEGTNETQRYAVRGGLCSSRTCVRRDRRTQRDAGQQSNNEPDIFYGTVPAAINQAFGDPVRTTIQESARVPQLRR